MSSNENTTAVNQLVLSIQKSLRQESPTCGLYVAFEAHLCSPTLNIKIFSSPFDVDYEELSLELLIELLDDHQCSKVQVSCLPHPRFL